MCVERVHEYYGMAGGGVVRQGSGGGRVGGELCAHGGRGQRERTTHEYYGVMVVLGGGGCVRWKDGSVHGIEGVGGGVGDGTARECMCTRTHACVRGHSSDSNRQRPDIGLCCYAICMYCTVGEYCRVAI